MAHVRERSPGVWEIIVATGRDPRSGRHKQISRTVRAVKRPGAKGPWPKAVTDKVHELEAEHGTDAGPGVRATVADLLDDYLEQKRSEGLEAKTLIGYEAIVRTVKVEGPRIAKVQVRRFSAADADRYYRWLRTELGPFPAKADALSFGRAPRKRIRWDGGKEVVEWVCLALSARSVHHHHMLLLQAFNMGVDHRWLPAPNPISVARPPALHVAPKDPVTADEVRHLVAAVVDEDKDFAALLLVAAMTGCRRGEVCGWRFSAIDFVAGQLTVKSAVSDAGGQVREKTTKTEKVRRMALDDLSLAIFAAQRLRYEDRCRQSGYDVRPDAFVFSQDDGHLTPYRPDRVTHTFGRLRKREGLDHLKLKDLRAFAATQMLAGGIDVRAAAARMGNDPAVTLRYYAGVVDARDHDAAKVLGAVLGTAAAEVLGPVELAPPIDSEPGSFS